MSEVLERSGGVVLFRREGGEVCFLLLKSRAHGEWGFPKGHLEVGEDFRAAALRELREETGIEGVRFLGPLGELSYPVGGRQKRVVYYLAEVLDGGEVVLSSEHTAYCWASGEEVLRLVPHENLRVLFQRLWRELEAGA
ncbi:MAG: NUDIX domain-containing protein [Planctomycetota bacterium]|nr:MAG: NUDIX domain-containing protein [Planctomycetota bacterium]